MVMELDDRIRAAQQEAKMKHSLGSSSRFGSSSRGAALQEHRRQNMQRPTVKKEPGLNKHIREAQTEANNKTEFMLANEMAAALGSSMLDKDLLGNWTDSRGNTVTVYSIDAFEMRLMATLSRPPRPDINLYLRPVLEGSGGWQCGDGCLDLSASSRDSVVWAFPDGNTSTWKRVLGGDSEAPMDIVALQLGCRQEAVFPGAMVSSAGIPWGIAVPVAVCVGTWNPEMWADGAA